MIALSTELFFFGYNILKCANLRNKSACFPNSFMSIRLILEIDLAVQIDFLYTVILHVTHFLF